MDNLALVESPKRQGMRSGTVRNRVELLLDCGFAASRLVVEASIQPDELERWRQRRPADDVEVKLGAWLIELDQAAEDAEIDFIETPTAANIFDAFDTARNDPCLALIYGGPGVGKSKTAMEYQIQLPLRTDPQNRVVVAEGNGRPRIVEILLNIVESLNVYGAANQKKQLRDEIVRNMGPGDLIIIDEAQFLEADTLDFLRSFLDEYGIGVAFCGNETLYTRFHGKGRAARFAQISSRVGARCEVMTPSEVDVDLFLQAYGVSGRKERELALHLGTVAGGLRVLDRVLKRSKALARQIQRPIDIEILKAVIKHGRDWRG